MNPNESVYAWWNRIDKESNGPFYEMLNREYFREQADRRKAAKK